MSRRQDKSKNKFGIKNNVANTHNNHEQKPCKWQLDLENTIGQFRNEKGHENPTNFEKINQFQGMVDLGQIKDYIRISSLGEV